MKNTISRRNFLITTASAGSLFAANPLANLEINSTASTIAKVDISKIDTLFQQAAVDSGAVGAQLSIIKSGEQFDFIYGIANAELNTPMTQDTIIQIGSVTKVFNAVVVMTMVEEGLLDLDTPVKRYIPEFTVADPMATRTLTLRHLISMSSGLDNGRYTNFGEGPDALGKYVTHLNTLP